MKIKGHAIWLFDSPSPITPFDKGGQGDLDSDEEENPPSSPFSKGEL